MTSTSGPVAGTVALQRELAARVDAEVRFDPGTSAVYAHDASNYRQVPIGVVVPRTVDAADGFSCRTQIRAGHLGREGIHLAQLLAGMLGDRGPADQNGE